MIMTVTAHSTVSHHLWYHHQWSQRHDESKLFARVREALRKKSVTNVTLPLTPSPPLSVTKTIWLFWSKMAFSGGEIFLAFFWRLPLGFEDGEWTVRDPRRPGDQVSGHTQERPGSLQVITVPVTGNVEDMIINIEGHASSVSTDTECVLAGTEWQRLVGARAPHTPLTQLRARD